MIRLLGLNATCRYISCITRKRSQKISSHQSSIKGKEPQSMSNYEVGVNGKLILNWKEDLTSELHVHALSLKVFLIEAHFHNSSITVFAGLLGNKGKPQQITCLPL